MKEGLPYDPNAMYWIVILKDGTQIEAHELHCFDNGIFTDSVFMEKYHISSALIESIIPKPE